MLLVVALFNTAQEINMRQKYWLIACALLLTITACVKDEVEQPQVDYTRDYFPLTEGKYVTYAVDSIVFDDAPGGNKKDTVHFQLRESVGSFEVINGDTIYYIYRSRRNNESESWKVKDVWTSRIVENEALKTEENLAFRKMIFPLKTGKRWISTAYIPASTTVLIGTENVQAYQEWEARVRELDIADQIGDFSFPDGRVAHIALTDTDDGSTKRFVLEKYVSGIGLAERIDTILDSRCIDIGDFEPCIGKHWLEHASKGYILSQVMIDHN